MAHDELFGGWRHIADGNDALLSTEPVLFRGVSIRAGSGGAADVQVYAGRAASAPPVMTYTVPANETQRFPEDPAILLEQGLFVAVGSNVAGLLVRYDPIQDRPVP